MLIGSNRKLQSKVALSVSIFDHCINNVTCFKYLGISISKISSKISSKKRLIIQIIEILFLII